MHRCQVSPPDIKVKETFINFWAFFNISPLRFNVLLRAYVQSRGRGWISLHDLNRKAPSCGVWQLYLQDPLKTWVKGRAILIGDAAHAMLPRKLLCASNKPALTAPRPGAGCLSGNRRRRRQVNNLHRYYEACLQFPLALGAYFAHITGTLSSTDTVASLLKKVEAFRFERATFIQAQSSRGTEYAAHDTEAKQDSPFNKYNMGYTLHGWAAEHNISIP